MLAILVGIRLEFDLILLAQGGKGSQHGFLFRTTDQIKADNPDLSAFTEYKDLLAAIRKIVEG